MSNDKKARMGPLPDLGALTLTPARNAVLVNNDLLVMILTALNNGRRDEACKLAQAWCATHKTACNDETWRYLLKSLFGPRAVTDSVRPELLFRRLCRRWDRGRLEKYWSAQLAWKNFGDLIDANAQGGVGAYKAHDIAHSMAILEHLKTNHGIDVENDSDYEEEFGWPFTDYRVWYFCYWALQWNHDALDKVIAAGLLRLDRALMAPVDYDTRTITFARPFRFFMPNRLLGIAIIETESDELEHIRYVLGLGVDPNKLGIFASHIVQGNELIPRSKLSYADEEGAEQLAFYHITHHLHEIFRMTNGYDNEDNAGGDGMLRIKGLLAFEDIYEELWKWGGDLYKASLMYRAHYHYTKNRTLLHFADRLLQLCERTYRAEIVPPQQAEKWYQVAVQRMHDRFPKINGLRFVDGMPVGRENIGHGGFGVNHDDWEGLWQLGENGRTRLMGPAPAPAPAPRPENAGDLSHDDLLDFWNQLS